MHKKRFFGAMFLTTGTTVGAGMLALPLVSVHAGFLPSSCLFILTWAMMLMSAMFMLEVNMCLSPGSNIISMADATLGKAGKMFTYTLYLLLLYALTAAYMSSLSELIQAVATNWLNLHVHPWLSTLVLVSFFGTMIISGTTFIAIANRWMVYAMAIIFAALISALLPSSSIMMMPVDQWSNAYHMLPITIAAFGYQIIIPTLRTYLKGNRNQLIQAITIGSLIALIMYFIWQWVVLGLVPSKGPKGLLAIGDHHQPIMALTNAISSQLKLDYIKPMARSFSFFAVLTSFVGVSLSLFDFLNDGFKMKRNSAGKMSTLAMTFLPPMFFTILFPKTFVLALGYAGTLVAILLGILPAVMLLRKRHLGLGNFQYCSPNGPIPAIAVIVFCLLVIIAEFIPILRF